METLPITFVDSSLGTTDLTRVKTSAFDSDIQLLDERESARIDELLSESAQPGQEIEQDRNQLKSITAEVKAIGKQGAVLAGERVYKARELLKGYKDGTFTKWLESTFGSRKTGYNMLAYFELSQALPHPELKEQFQRMPLGVAYVLASREGEIDKKCEIIRDSTGKSAEAIVQEIQNSFPASSGDERVRISKHSVPIDEMVDEVRVIVKKLCKKHKAGFLSGEHTQKLSKIRDLLDSIIPPKVS